MISYLAKIYSRRIYPKIKFVRGTHLVKRNFQNFALDGPIDEFNIDGVEMLALSDSDAMRRAFFEVFDEVEVLTKDFVGDVDTFVDVGANQGLFSNFIQERFECSVVAYEPVPLNQSILRLNSSYYNRDIQIKGKAVSDEQGYINFHVSKGIGSARSSISLANSVQKSSDIEVEQVKLSEEEVMPADLVKIDVEGAELQVLKGAEDTLDEVKVIFLELHSSSILNELGTDKTEVLEFLRDKNFELFSLDGGKFSESEPEENEQVIARKK